MTVKEDDFRKRHFAAYDTVTDALEKHGEAIAVATLACHAATRISIFNTLADGFFGRSLKGTDKVYGKLEGDGAGAISGLVSFIKGAFCGIRFITRDITPDTTIDDLVEIIRNRLSKVVP